jgi:hypothetical protein
VVLENLQRLAKERLGGAIGQDFLHMPAGGMPKGLPAGFEGIEGSCGGVGGIAAAIEDTLFGDVA